MPCPFLIIIAFDYDYSTPLAYEYSSLPESCPLTMTTALH